MSILKKIACFQNKKDEIPNQELARELVKNNNTNGINEIADNLWNEDKNIQYDCIKVLYEIGYINPELIKDYLNDFLKLLKNKNNRLIWGGMIALSTIADLKSKEIFENFDIIINSMKTGSVITIDNGIKILAIIASKNDTYNDKIFPFLLNHLKNCRSKEVPQHAEKILIAINTKNKKEYIDIINYRLPALSGSQVLRIKKIFKQIEKMK